MSPFRILFKDLFRSKGFPIFRRLDWLYLPRYSIIKRNGIMWLWKFWKLSDIPSNKLNKAMQRLRQFETCPRKTCLFGVLQSDLVWTHHKWHFQGLSDLHLGNQKVTAKKLVILLMIKYGYTVQTQLSSEVTLLMWRYMSYVWHWMFLWHQVSCSRRLKKVGAFRNAFFVFEWKSIFTAFIPVYGHCTTKDAFVWSSCSMKKGYSLIAETSDIYWRNAHSFQSNEEVLEACEPNT